MGILPIKFSVVFLAFKLNFDLLSIDLALSWVFPDVEVGKGTSSVD